jgi:adenine-specific DNA-methyltransferase
MISLIPKSDDFIIIDFFAGSGTTGDAVMQLNSEDIANGKEGNKKYILVQLPEIIDEKKNKTAYDFVKNELCVDKPTIFEITKERLVRTSKKIEKGDLGFKIFETTPIWEDYEFKAVTQNANQELFEESKLTDIDIQTLLTTWKTYDNISLSKDLDTVDLGGYNGYYADNKLYLMHKGFEAKHLKNILEEVDNKNDFNPTSVIVFGYHFDSKNLREISENISSYANKKGIEIDFVTRY